MLCSTIAKISNSYQNNIANDDNNVKSFLIDLGETKLIKESPSGLLNPKRAYLTVVDNKVGGIIAGEYAGSHRRKAVIF